MRKFVFFGGKGGVGKTTVSAAFALKSARAGLRTLLVSTDPAHSTSDVFDQPIGDEPRSVDGYEHLYAMEIDPDEEIEAHMREIKRRMGDQVSPVIVNEIDRHIELAHRTPGAHEAALFDRIIEVMAEADGWDRVVFDTSPTGGTLRLLSLPDLLGDWIDRLEQKRTRSIDLFEKAAIGDRRARRKKETDPILAHLTERRRRFEFAGEMLREHATFFLVLNPDELSIRETARTITELAEHGLRVEGLVVNRITPGPGDDEEGPGADYLRARAATERDRIREVAAALDPPIVGRIETRVEEVKGRLLSDLARELSIDVGTEVEA